MLCASLYSRGASLVSMFVFFFFSSRRRHTRSLRDWSSDVCSSDLTFNQIKETPKSATLTHLDEWLSRLTWLQAFGDMAPLVKDIRPAKVKHLAQEAGSLHATNLRSEERRVGKECRSRWWHNH